VLEIRSYELEDVFQVMIDVSNILPHPNPPLIKGREPDFLVSPLYKAGLFHSLKLVKLQVLRGEKSWVRI
jgi:hypothetical protein